MKANNIKPIPEVNGSFETFQDYNGMSKEQLIAELMRKDIEVSRAKKRILGERRWKDEGIHTYKRLEYQIDMELSTRWPIKSLCKEMSISRSGYYKWKARLSNPCPRVKKRMSDIIMFEKYHEKYPSHGYRWLNSKIKLDSGLIMSDQYAHRCCKFAGIKSKSKHYKYKNPGEPKKIFPNAVMASLDINGPHSNAL